MVRFLIAVFFSLAQPALAQVPADLVRVGLETGWRDADGTHIAGLTILLSPGWKTYWRAPGDAGIPPSFNWSGSTNLSSASVHFPVPEVFDQDGIRTIGYHDRVTFPLQLTPSQAGQAIRLRAEVEIGVCDEICVPITLRLKADLEPGGQASDALLQILHDGPEAGGEAECDIRPMKDGLLLNALARISPLGSDEFAVVEIGRDDVWVSPPVLRRAGGALSAEVELVPPDARPFSLSRSDVRMTVFGGGRAVEMRGCD